jgi:PAS domain S-box-containing protein
MRERKPSEPMLPGDSPADPRPLDVTTILDADATIRYVSPSIEPILGYKPEQLIGKNWFQYIHPDDAATVQPAFDSARQQPGATRRNAMRFRHADGSWVKVEGIGSNLLHYPGVTGWIVNANLGAGRRPEATHPQPCVDWEEEGPIAAALARLGQELISSLDLQVLLDRVCRVACETLDCDCCQILLFETETDAYVPVAGFGQTPDEWESMRRVRLPRAAVAGLQDTTEPVGPTPNGPDPMQHPLFHLPRQYGIPVSLCVPLTRAGDIVGYLYSGYRSRAGTFTSRQRRLFAGIGHLASMAIQNGQFVQELERGQQLKSHFVATLSHELRTPLNVIIGYHDLLLDGTFGDLTSEQAYTLRRAHRNAEELLDLINATLDLSRLEARRLPLNVRDLDLEELVDELAREAWDLTAKSELSVQWLVPAEVPRVRTDRMKLKMVLKNLVSNAIKFTDSGSVIVEVRPRSTTVEFCVQDTGIGIAPDALAVIFEPFRQAGRDTTARYGGTGLGLYIVRRLLDFLGGTITVESRLNHGTTFRFWIPYDAPPQEQDA